MPCLSENDLDAYLGKRLSPAAADELVAHVAECGVCRTLMAKLARALTVESGPVPVGPPGGDGETAHAELLRTWRSQGVDGAQLAVDERGTVGRAGIGGSHAEQVARLPRLLDSATNDEILLLDILGEGGMGVVWLAEQQALGRQVAVKMPRSDAKDQGGIADLLREGRTMGLLEHPNVVPVHQLGRDGNDLPLLVMKRVEGRTWAERLRETFGTPLHLETHLEVLLKVCHAVQFAHSRGVLHRDLKPDNVLLGEFGEVYVADWGLALGFGENPPSGVPTAATSPGVSGTPHYMAPEMAAGRVSELGPASDVYLLGAILHEILTGHRRHIGASLTDVLASAYASLPVEYEPRVPVDLARICNRATAYEPQARYPSVAELRAAVAGFLRDRGANLLCGEAERQLREARGLSGEAEQERRRDLISASRFGFEQALRISAGSPRAELGRAEVIELMVEQELERGFFGAAAALLSELPSAHPELAARVEDLGKRVRARAERVEALERAAREQDLGQAAALRRRFGVWFGAAILVVHAGLGIADHLHALSLGYLHYVGITLGLGLVCGLVVLPYRRLLTPNAVTRRLYLVLSTLIGAQYLSLLACWALGLPLRTALAVSLFQLGGAICIKTLSMEERVLWTGLVALATGGAAILWPAATLVLVGLAYAVFLIAAALLTWDEAGELRGRAPRV